MTIEFVKYKRSKQFMSTLVYGIPLRNMRSYKIELKKMQFSLNYFYHVKLGPRSFIPLHESHYHHSNWNFTALSTRDKLPIPSKMLIIL